MCFQKYFVFRSLLAVVMFIFLTGCSSENGNGLLTTTVTAELIPTSVPMTSTPMPTPSVLPNQNETPEPGLLNPLTGQPPAWDQLLERRPVLVKVQNVPRNSRPQWGLSKADIVFEYYIEYGDTRFAALYYGQQPEKVGPIRSARHADIHLVQMYGAVLVYGGAYEALNKMLLESDFGKRLVREGPYTYPALFRYEPQGHNYLLADLTKLPDIIEKYKMDNTIPKLNGMIFNDQPPDRRDYCQQLFVRFSGGIYNRWDYDPQSGRFLRFSETKDDIERKEEGYAQLMDRLDGQPIAADNVVVILAEYSQVGQLKPGEEVFNIDLTGTGKAYAARNGKIYELQWQRHKEDELLMLAAKNGDPFELKPGQTWYEIMGVSTKMKHDGDSWFFSFAMP